MVQLITPGLSEGDYITWAWKWTEEPPAYISSMTSIDVLIDEKNGVISAGFRDRASAWRFGVYKISDFSVVFESPTGSSYTYQHCRSNHKLGFHHSNVTFNEGGISRSLQTYLLLQRSDQNTIEVWRGGSSPVWSRNVSTDFGRAIWFDAGGISLTGKYALVVVTDKTSPYHTFLMLYEGV